MAMTAPMSPTVPGRSRPRLSDGGGGAGERADASSRREDGGSANNFDHALAGGASANNFDHARAYGSANNFDHARAGGGEGDDGGFRDLARAAATGMGAGDGEDWDSFCSELFTQELAEANATGPGIAAAAAAAVEAQAAPPSTVVAAPPGRNPVPAPAPTALGLPWVSSSSLQFSHPRNGNGHPVAPLPGTVSPSSAAAPTPAPAGQPAKLRRIADGTALPTNAGGIANASWANLSNKCTPEAQAKANSAVGEGFACVHCQFPGAEVRVRCPNGCAYHARCLDLLPLGRRPHGRTAGGEAGRDEAASPGACLRRCPHCALPATGLEILPLDFAEMDRVQRAARAAFAGPRGAKRPHEDPAAAAVARSADLGWLPTVSAAGAGGAPPPRTSQCYDPARPRIGRWTPEEILFRDALIAHFLAGSLPLADGLKLNDFLPAILQSKQSRLAKKMKNAKLSTKYFHPNAGRLAAPAARELSRLERDFVASVIDPVERAEIRFHMGREWREHFARRCAALAVAVDGAAWLGSVEEVERRLLLERERHRARRRAFMMGKAMEKDCDTSGNPLHDGVFVKSAQEEEEVELVVARSVSNSAGSQGGGRLRSGSVVADLNGTKGKEDASGVWSSDDPNFRQASPFLAAIATYIERNGVPFEHIDVWVPSSSGDATEGSGAAKATKGALRLCFGGSVTVGVQVVDEENPSPGDALQCRRPLTPETRSDLALFGRYSEKFSFSTGCGLPGRIFQSGIATWERFVAEAESSQFERRGGAIQFGVKTAVGLPVESPNVGRVVVVLYSKFDRQKDDGLVGRMMADLKVLCPCPRWKLVVEVDSKFGNDAAPRSLTLSSPPPVLSPPITAANANTVSANTGLKKDELIPSLLTLLAANMPSDMNSSLGQQVDDIMTLRLLLLRVKTPEEETLVDTVLVLYESYLRAGRSEQDIVVMVTRDFKFHLTHLRGLAENKNHQVNSNRRGAPSNMNAAAQAVMAQATDADSLRGKRPLLATQAPVHMVGSPLMGSTGGGAEVQGQALPTNGRPLSNPFYNYNHQNFHTVQQYSHLISPPMTGTNPVTLNNTNYSHPGNQTNPFLMKQNSIAISIGDTDDTSLKSTASS